MKDRYLYEIKKDIRIEDITLANKLKTKQFLRVTCDFYFPVKYYKDAIMLAQVHSKPGGCRIQVEDYKGQQLFIDYRRLNITPKSYIKKTNICIQCNTDLVGEIISSNRKYREIIYSPDKKQKKKRSKFDKGIYHTSSQHIHIYRGGGCSPK